MNLFTVPLHLPFLDAVATEWLARGGEPLDASRGLILLPTRRAARALAEAFLRVSGGRALLLPRITALGALDEAPLALAGSLELPPAVEPAQRLAALARMILAMGGADGAPKGADRAWRLAEELAALMDEAELAEVDLAARLPDAADPAFARHWARTLEFLRIVTAAWPDWLAEQRMMNPAARQVALLDAQAAAWARNPPDARVLVAGATGGIPAVARLARVVARLPMGAVVLPGVDLGLSGAAWDALEPSHPQAGLRRLLHGLGATRGDVAVWPVFDEPRLVSSSSAFADHDGEGVPACRTGLLRRALLPGAALVDWQDERGEQGETAGLFRLDAADQQQEATAIALVLRQALERPGARAALVTPDRALAGRVASELLRWGVVADDSAGEPLADTPPAVFLRLLARAVAEELAPVPLLALLKHPLAGAGLAPAACRAAARALELACLRGPRPAPGLTGLRLALELASAQRRADATALLARLETCLEPALRIAAGIEVAPHEALSGLIEAAERLATTDETEGQARLWAGEEGAALAERLSAVLATLPVLPDQKRGVIPGLLDAVLVGAAVRGRRALRGRDGAEHPRVFIWGLLEARLQAVDVMVLGGLAERVWPPAADPGPWLSRPMRARAGLPSPEEQVGQAAHDFVSAACAAPVVVLSCPRRRDGAPAVPARWLTRLEAFLTGRGTALAVHPAAAWAQALDQPDGPARPVRPPTPCPAVARRPRKLSVTEIETWLRDPYAIHARHVLRLRPLDPLEQETDAADYGALVHAGLHRFLEEHGVRWPPNAALKLREHLVGALVRAGLRETLRNWWAPRLERIADWVAEIEVERRSRFAPVGIRSEVPGTWEMLRPGGRFTLAGRADRIERRADGSMAILDYKTGTVPSQTEVDAGLAPQLPLEAVMAAAGGFGPECDGAVAELAYWRITGGFVPGEARSLFKGDPAAVALAAGTAAQALGALIDAFDDPERCYLSQPHPGRAPRFPDYAQLARVAEWVAAGEEE